MAGILTHFLDTNFRGDYLPMGQGYLWDPALVGLQATTSALIAAGSFLISGTLIGYLLKRKFKSHLRWLLRLFAVTLFLVGLTQVLDLAGIWHPHYWAEVALKSLTAVVAIYTGIRLAPLLPRAAAMPTPEILAALNHALEQEIQNRRRIEDELRSINASLESRIQARAADAAYLATLVDASDDPIIGRDKDGTILSWNKGAQRLFGYEEGEVLGHNIRMLLPPDDKEREFDKVIVQPLQGEVLRDYQTLRRCKDATLLPVSVSVSVVKETEGRAIGTMAVYRDLRSILKAENELQRQRDELARSNADLEQFAYVASHDLKAPLRAIGNLARWLSDDLGDHLRPQDLENLGLMKQRVGRMNRMLDDLLAYSRAGNEGAGLPISLPELLQEVWDSLGAPPKFRLESAGLPDVPVASTEFRQVLLNLLSNAIKHHDREQGQIGVAASLDGDTLTLCVTDDGPGIPPRDRERVFQMFQTLRPRDEVEGTGIGLALVKKLAQRRGGRAWLEDAPGRGCKACLEWPLAMKRAPL